jgi:hypothetical protein
VLGALFLKEVPLRSGYVPAEEGVVLGEPVDPETAQKAATPKQPATPNKKAAAAKKMAPVK